mgnify:CR=1 FL=1
MASLIIMTHNHIGQELAIKEALKSTHRFRVGCAVMAGKREQSRGRNSLKTHSSISHAENNGLKRKTHAEIAALSKAHKFDTKDSTIYVARLLKDCRIAMAKPCSKCMKIISDSGIKNVVYSINGGWEKIKV